MGDGAETRIPQAQDAEAAAPIDEDLEEVLEDALDEAADSDETDVIEEALAEEAHLPAPRREDEFVCSTCFLIKPNRTDPSSRDLEMTMHDEAVRSLVKQPPVVVYPESTLRAVAQTLSEEWIGAVVVRGTRPPGAPGSRAEGVVSERDIVQALADGLDPDTTRAQDVMTLDLACAAPDESVLEVTARMLDNEIRHMPVIEDGVVVGVVSERDALRVLVDEHRAGTRA